MRPPLRRLIPLAVLLVWMAPAVGVAISAMHVLLDHHGEHGHGHDGELGELGRALGHGHEHDLATPAHDHEAPVTAKAPLRRPAETAVVAWAPRDVAAMPREETVHRDRGTRRGPPGPLFTTHCALLL